MIINYSATLILDMLPINWCQYTHWNWWKCLFYEKQSHSVTPWNTKVYMFLFNYFCLCSRRRHCKWQIKMMPFLLYYIILSCLLRMRPLVDAKGCPFCKIQRKTAQSRSFILSSLDVKSYLWSDSRLYQTIIVKSRSWYVMIEAMVT